ncbi:MAG: ParB N-terminal domain-containing protein [Desulfobacter sp.]|nr:MAG: ParB N-terminal domain-containing protein [Desulfobacter sp.]
MIKFFKQLFSGKPPEEDTDHVSSFNEQQAEEEDVEFIDHGNISVPLDKITGSVGKYHDFDSRFRPKKHVSGKRFADIKRTMREGGGLPPVSLYQIRNDYYVLDGNHRVAAAKELGWTDIKAKVVELLSGRNTMENLIYIEKKKFFDKTKLKEKIDLTEIGKYNFLEKQILKHQIYLAAQSGRDCDLQKAAKDWHNTIYLPMTAIINSSGLLKYFPDRGIADLYTYISYHHWTRKAGRKYGIGIDQVIPKSMEAFRKSMLEKTTPEYPEMKRTITAFVFINVGVATQNEILEALYALDEIQEVHSVHGSIDILVKMVLQRDFLASDAETIAEFVDHHIRRIEGINRTQTIIPGISKVKTLFNT